MTSKTKAKVVKKLIDVFFGREVFKYKGNLYVKKYIAHNIVVIFAVYKKKKKKKGKKKKGGGFFVYDNDCGVSNIWEPTTLVEIVGELTQTG